MTDSTFKVPYVPPNPSSWGPLDTSVTENDPDAPKSKFHLLPYAPFGRSDRIGRAADFTQSAFRSQQQHQHRDRRRFGEDQGKNLEFQYKVDNEEESSFQLVDTTPRTTSGGKRFVTPGARRRGAHQQRLRQLNARRGNETGGQPGGRYNQPQRTRRRTNFGRGGGNRGGWQNRVDRQASVSVRPDWKRVDEFDLAKFAKNIPAAEQVAPTSEEDLLWCGFLDQYNDQYDRVATRSAVPLKRVENRDFYPVTTTDDPVIEKLAIDGAGNVFATDAILAHLMTSPRSVYPWDIVVQKLPGLLFFDKRDSSQFDYLTVNETANNPPSKSDDDPDGINTPERLSLEATMINQNFTQQILKSSKTRTNFDLPNPFYDPDDNDGMEPASVAYRYRKFDLGDGIQLVARTELHGLVKKKTTGGSEDTQYMTAYALNEFDSAKGPGHAPSTASINWRDKIDSQRGAVLATELKNNSFKLAKWTAQSVLAGASQMKIGFVSRAAPKNAYEHTILATQFYRPKDFATQITLSVGGMWGIMRMLIKLFQTQPEGKYVLMRDPNKPILRIYAVPPGTFEEDDDDEEEEEEEKEGGN
mmetsp:Transcript_34461/g.50536  ORF Transcript_34461/g.50536 Transcript_34461/m.50536 type:complete len:585 (+) Transcript_34461:103-1857(+)